MEKLAWLFGLQCHKDREKKAVMSKLMGKEEEEHKIKAIGQYQRGKPEGKINY